MSLFRVINQLNRKLTQFMLITLVVLFSFSTATAASFVGYWQTVSDRNNKPAGVVKIWKTKKGRYYGKIMEIYRQGGNKPDDRCLKCVGEFKNKRIKGITMLFALQKTKPNYFENGKILDPKSGKVYKCYVELDNKGKRAKVRGYIGFSWLGRTQYWYRLDSYKRKK